MVNGDEACESGALALADPNDGPLRGTSFSEGVAVDAAGNIYGAEVGPKGLKKYVRREQ